MAKTVPGISMYGMGNTMATVVDPAGIMMTPVCRLVTGAVSYTHLDVYKRQA